MTNINFRFRKGAGSNLDIIFGTVTLKPTLAHSRGTSMVLPAPSTWDIVNGEVKATNVQPTPEPVEGVLEWGYEVTVKDRHGKSYSFLVGVPDSTTDVEFVSLPRYFETKPPLFGQGPKGDAGEAATVTVGNVTSGSEASITNSGTSSDAILDFVLPKGDKGDRGDGVPAGGTALQYIRKDATGNTTEWATLDKASLGLDNVDNTSDDNKPVSIPQKEYIDNSGVLLNGSKKASDSPSTYRNGLTTALSRVSDGWPSLGVSDIWVSVTTSRTRNNNGGVLQWVTAYNDINAPVLFRVSNSNDTWGEFKTLTEFVPGGFVPRQQSEYSNVVVGKDALASATGLRVRNNNAFGIGAMQYARRARYNDAFGLNALHYLDSGPDEPDLTFKATRNSAFGSNSQRFNVTGYNNISMGRNSLQCSVDGTDNVALGAGSMAGVAPIGLGGDIENHSPTSAKQNTAVGVSTLDYVLSDNNTAVGFQAARNIKKSTGNVSIGAGSLTALDKNSGVNGKNKISAGWSVPYTIVENVISFTRSSSGLQPNNYVSIGFPGTEYQLLQVTEVVGDRVTLAPRSEGIADSAGTATVEYYTTNSDAKLNNYNTALGFNSLGNLEGSDSLPGTAASNTALGLNSMRYMQDGTPAKHVAGSVALGANSRVSGNDQVQLGAENATVYAAQPIQVRSDARDKTDVRDTVLGLDFISRLRPVDYRWDRRSEYYEMDEDGTIRAVREPDGSRKGERFHHGLIAQEVQQIIEEIGIDFGGYQDHRLKGGNDVRTIAYEELIAPLIKAVQELSEEIKELKKNTN